MPSICWSIILIHIQVLVCLGPLILDISGCSFQTPVSHTSNISICFDFRSKGQIVEGEQWCFKACVVTWSPVVHCCKISAVFGFKLWHCWGRQHPPLWPETHCNNWMIWSVLLLMAEIWHQLRLVVYPIIYRVSYIPGGAGFQPSTVS